MTLVTIARGVSLVGLAGLLLLPAPARAQTPATARLVVTVVDPSGAVIPGATVTVTGLEDATRVTTPPPARTTDRGVWTFEKLAPGRYTLQAEFAGFEPRLLKDVRLRAGENRHVMLLALKAVQEAVTVDRDRQIAAADPRGRAFGTILTREEIMALSDDPDEMRQQLLDMVGPGAIIRVDSFEGGRLPPKAQIKSIRITRDNFAAENHSVEFDSIDITTQPGVGPLRAALSSRFRDGSMSGRSPFTPTKGPERSSSFESNLGGTLVKDRSSFSIAGGGLWAFDTPNLNAALPGGVRAEVLNLRRPTDRWSVNSLLDYALTPAHALRASYGQNYNNRKALGVGAYDLPERAYATETRDRSIRVIEVGQLGRRMFSTARLQFRWSDSESHSSLEAPTIRVNDWFTSGGAQVAGGRHARDLVAGWDVDYVHGMQTFRGGAILESGRYRADDAVNYLGTYVFTSLDAFTAGLPRLYLRRIGDPLVTYSNTQVGLYLQDDIRITKGLAISPGLRYEAQTHVGDAKAFGPRFGAQWAPSKNGRTILRGSWAMFYNWLASSIYEQTLRVDGVRQRELNIVNPTYPDPGTGGVIPATNRYLLGDVALPRSVRASAGLDQTVTPHVRVTASYSYVGSTRLPWGRNLNAPVQGVRPDLSFANVVEVGSGGRSTSHQLSATLALNLNGPSSASGFVNVRRTTVNLSYFLARAKNDTDGAFTVPPSGTLATEWGPALNDRRHRMAAAITTQAVRNLNLNLSVAANTSLPFTVTTGFDDNGDSIFNDRPAGVGRGSARGAAFVAWGLNATYAIGLGPTGAGGGAANGKGGPGRYRLSWTLSVTNLTNRANYTGYSGVITSPFFLHPTSVQNPRKIDFGMNFSF